MYPGFGKLGVPRSFKPQNRSRTFMHKGEEHAQIWTKSCSKKGTIVATTCAWSLRGKTC